MNIAAIRQEYLQASLDEDNAGADPIALFADWFSAAQRAAIDEVNAMTLATVSAAGQPRARIVLLKGLDADGFVFYTNYDSAKGNELKANPQASLLFFWKELERQVRIEGRVEKVSTAESDAYYNSRPEGSRIGAWASPQSQEINDREALEDLAESLTQKFAGMDIPRPDFWGGYRLVPQRIEFWQGRKSRLHDRIVFERENAGAFWQRSRLAP